VKINVMSLVVKYAMGCHIRMKVDALMQTEITVSSGKSNLKGK